MRFASLDPGNALALRWRSCLRLELASVKALPVSPIPSRTGIVVPDPAGDERHLGRTVMVGTKLEEFGAEVLGVMRDVSPGRDTVLCHPTGVQL